MSQYVFSVDVVTHIAYLSAYPFYLDRLDLLKKVYVHSIPEAPLTLLRLFFTLVYPLQHLPCRPTRQTQVNMKEGKDKDRNANESTDH